MRLTANETLWEATGLMCPRSRCTRPIPAILRVIVALLDLTGVPMVLKTSFSENEPIVCRPQEALDCPLRTKMDALVLANRILERSHALTGAVADAPATS